MRGKMVLMAGAGFVALASGVFAIYELWQIAPDTPARSAANAQVTQPVPIIATYESGLQRSAERVARRDPRAFWVRQIVARLEDKKPVAIDGLKQPATAQVSFTVAHDGTLVSKAIAKASGDPAVDQEALLMLDRAQPFPPMPAAMTEPALSFSLPLRFR